MRRYRRSKNNRLARREITQQLIEMSCDPPVRIAILVCMPGADGFVITGLANGRIVPRQGGLRAAN